MQCLWSVFIAVGELLYECKHKFNGFVGCQCIYYIILLAFLCILFVLHFIFFMYVCRTFQCGAKSVALWSSTLLKFACHLPNSDGLSFKIWLWVNVIESELDCIKYINLHILSNQKFLPFIYICIKLERKFGHNPFPSSFPSKIECQVVL